MVFLFLRSDYENEHENDPAGVNARPVEEFGMDHAEAVYAFVKTVPAGKVVTYGQVAGLVTGVTVSAREVGAIMNTSPPGVPWQRVVGAGGHLPIGKRSPMLKSKQREMLEAEGVEFLPNDCVDMTRYQWRAPEPPGGLFDIE
jgi:methylated-DNA-protein-cysteine methyltransferase-like protein